MSGASARIEFDGSLGPDLDRHAQLGGCRLEIGGDLSDRVVLRLDRSEQDLSAEPVGALEKRYLVSAARCNLGHFQPGRTAAGHDDALARRRDGDETLAHRALAAGARIVDAAKGLFLARLVDACVVASDADTDQVAPSRHQLVWDFRIGDERARHTDEVSLAGGEERLSRCRRKPAEGDHGNAARLLQYGVDLAEIARGDGCRRNLHPETGERASVRVEVVNLARHLEGCRHLQPVLLVVAEDRELVDAHAHAEGHVRTGRFLDRIEHFEAQAHAVLEGTAVAVGPTVEEGRRERAQQPVMGDLDLHAVEAGVDHVARARRESRDDGPDVLLVHGLRRVIARRFRHLGRSPHDRRRTLERRVAAVGELSEELGAMPVDRLSHLGHARHDYRVPGIDEAARHLAGRVDGLALEDDKPDAAACPFLMIGNVVIGGHAVGMAERREVRLKHDAVAQRNAPDREGTEQMGKSAAGSRFLRHVSQPNLVNRLRKRLTPRSFKSTARGYVLIGSLRVPSVAADRAGGRRRIRGPSNSVDSRQAYAAPGPALAHAIDEQAYRVLAHGKCGLRHGGELRAEGSAQRKSSKAPTAMSRGQLSPAAWMARIMPSVMKSLVQ